MQAMKKIAVKKKSPRILNGSRDPFSKILKRCIRSATRPRQIKILESFKAQLKSGHPLSAKQRILLTRMARSLRCLFEIKVGPSKEEWKKKIEQYNANQRKPVVLSLSERFIGVRRKKVKGPTLK